MSNAIEDFHEKISKRSTVNGAKLCPNRHPKLRLVQIALIKINIIVMLVKNTLIDWMKHTQNYNSKKFFNIFIPYGFILIDSRCN